MKVPREYVELAYFPFLYMGNEKEIPIGLISICNFDLNKNELFPEDEIQIVENFLTKHIEGKTPISGIGIVKFNDKRLRLTGTKTLELIELTFRTR